MVGVQRSQEGRAQCHSQAHPCLHCTTTALLLQRNNCCITVTEGSNSGLARISVQYIALCKPHCIEMKLHRKAPK